MQFIKNGPDIPDRLLHAHEDGRVVFFCGAGISCPAGLPGFEELVRKVFCKMGIDPSPAQKRLIKAGEFDAAIDSLESSRPDGRDRVRREIADILRPDFDAPGATKTHEALLELGKCREGRTRLVTTNFDRIFEKAVTAGSLKIDRFCAPLLPPPKKRWSGLVYLHGLLPECPVPCDLEKLVISSGDFGRAYLTERWASRFITELFRNYVVCFVGYSIGDRVLRYMLDAFSAEQKQGEPTQDVYAFSSFSKGKESDSAEEWQAKKVIPILYRKFGNHHYLRKTLSAWAGSYSDGLRGKERIVLQTATALPRTCTPQDDFVSRLLWALNDPSGLPAKLFAEMDKVPSLDWLGPLSEKRYNRSDLEQFGILANDSADDSFTFSFIRRPAPYHCNPLMCVASEGNRSVTWDEPMKHIANWLVRHINDPKLIIWLVCEGGKLHEDLAWKIEHKLDWLIKIEQNKNFKLIDHIRANAPNAIPSRAMRTLWRLLLTDRVKQKSNSLRLYTWRDRYLRDGLTATLRLELRYLLSPRVLLLQSRKNGGEDEKRSDTECVNDLVGWEIVLTEDQVHLGWHEELFQDEDGPAALPTLLPDFTMLLRDALDLMNELGEANDTSDLSYIAQPSISKHSQNKRFHQWTALIELTRDAWLALAKISPQDALLEAQAWWNVPYPLFKRLSLFAATHRSVVPETQALDWLMDDGCRWLWSDETRREAICLLVSLSSRNKESIRSELEQAILAGPPPNFFVDVPEPQCRNVITDREIWLRLSKISSAGGVLSADAMDRLHSISERYPEWELTDEQSEEFPFYSVVGANIHPVIPVPRKCRDIMVWLMDPPPRKPFQNDDWEKRCRENFPAVACALCALAKDGKWPIHHWNQAFVAWTEQKHKKLSWRHLAPVIASAKDSELKMLSHCASIWINSISSSFRHHEALFLSICQRILALDFPEDSKDGYPLHRAINHPIGQITEALLTWCQRYHSSDVQGLPETLIPIFTKLCDTGLTKLHHGRVLLSSRATNLFRLDPEWTTKHLLPLFDWTKYESVARAMWEGFLWAPRLDFPLLSNIKKPFLQTAEHCDLLGKFSRHYVSLLTYVALDREKDFSDSEMRKTTKLLSDEDLLHAARTLVEAVKGPGRQRAQYFRHRVLRYLDSVWPNDDSRKTPSIAETFALLCIHSGAAFPDAFCRLRSWLIPSSDPDFLISELHDTGICQLFPEPALELLDILIKNYPQHPPRNLQLCLDQIYKHNPDLECDSRYIRLHDFLRKFEHC